MKIPLHSGALLAFGFVLSVTSVSAAEVGKIKVSTGAVYIERAAQRLPAAVGAEVLASDTIITGETGSAGNTFIRKYPPLVRPNGVPSNKPLRIPSNQPTRAFVTLLPTPCPAR